jgi:hypothetical protein
VASADDWRAAVLGLGVRYSSVDGGCCSVVLEVVVPSKCCGACWRFAGGSRGVCVVSIESCYVRGLPFVGLVLLRSSRSALCR